MVDRDIECCQVIVYLWLHLLRYYQEMKVANSCDNFLLHFFDDLDRRAMMRPLTLLLVAYPSPLQLTVSLSILFASFSSLWWRLTEPLLFSSLPFSSRPMQDLVPRLFLFSSLSLRLTQVLDLNNLKPAGTFLLLLLLEPSPPSQGEKGD